jgi:hypothetical protein
MRSVESFQKLFILTFLTLLILIPIGPIPVITASSALVNINADGSFQFQTFSGFGATLTPFGKDGIFHSHDPSQPAKVSVTPEQRTLIAQMLFQELGLSRTRVFPDGYEPQNDNSDPFTFNANAYDWTKVNELTDFVSLARPFGLSTWWTSFSVDSGGAQAWLRKSTDSCALDPSKVDEEVEWLLAAALRFRDLGDELPYLTINNEPDLCPKIVISDYVEIVKRLGKRMRDFGLSTKIAVSDGWIPENAIAYMQAVLANPEASQYVGALAFHAYDGYDNPHQILQTSALGNPPLANISVRERIRDLALSKGLPVWMTEVCYCVPRDFSTFQLLLARLNHLQDELTITNVSAFDAMNLYFIERPSVYDELVHVYFNADGTLNHAEISPYGKMLGHYSRFIKSGSVRIKVESSDPLVRVVGFEQPNGGLTLVFINNNPTDVQAKLSLSGLHSIPISYSMLVSTDSDLWEEQPSIRTNGASFEMVLKPSSITTLSGE